MGTRNILLLMAIILILSAPLFGGAFFKKRVLLVLFPILFVPSGPSMDRPSRSKLTRTPTLFEETDYFTDS